MPSGALPSEKETLESNSDNAILVHFNSVNNKKQRAKLGNVTLQPPPPPPPPHLSSAQPNSTVMFLKRNMAKDHSASPIFVCSFLPCILFVLFVAPKLLLVRVTRSVWPHLWVVRVTTLLTSPCDYACDQYVWLYICCGYLMGETSRLCAYLVCACTCKQLFCVQRNTVLRL